MTSNIVVKYNGFETVRAQRDEFNFEHIRSMDIQKQHLCPRLVDYLTIVGARPYTSGKGLAPVQVRLLTNYLTVIIPKFTESPKTPNKQCNQFVVCVLIVVIVDI